MLLRWTFCLRQMPNANDEFYALVAADGYGTPRALPKKTEAKLKRLIELVRSKTQHGLLGTTHITPVGGNVFLDLRFPPGEAEQLLADSDERSANTIGHPAPPAGHATWLDYAVATMDTRSVEIERLLDDAPGVQNPTREEMRLAVRAELDALRQQALSACRALRAGQQ